MSRWTTAERVRRLNGLPIDENDPNYTIDTDLDYYIDSAQEMVVPDISTLKRDDQLTGDIDESNVYFYTSTYPIADWNYDGSISVTDVDVYGWGDLEDYNTKTSIAVSAIDNLIGRITLSSAPSSTFEVLTCDYRWTMYEHNYTLIDVATAFLAGFLYLNAEYMEVPLTVRIGAQSYRYKDSPAQRSWNSYLLTMSRLKTNQISVGKRKGMSLSGVG